MNSGLSGFGPSPIQLNVRCKPDIFPIPQSNPHQAGLEIADDEQLRAVSQHARYGAV